MFWTGKKSATKNNCTFNCLRFFYRKLRIREQANDGKWHHICVTWRNRYEIWGFYKDGRLVRWNWILTGGHRYVIKGGGSLVLGQSHDTNGGNFDPKRSFQGTLANVNVWSHALSDRQIKNLSKSCLAGVGDVYSWSDFRDGVKGKTAMVILSPCHPHSSQEWLFRRHTVQLLKTVKIRINVVSSN